jgi:hypothetical protein
LGGNDPGLGGMPIKRRRLFGRALIGGASLVHSSEHAAAGCRSRLEPVRADSQRQIDALISTLQRPVDSKICVCQFDSRQILKKRLRKQPVKMGFGGNKRREYLAAREKDGDESKLPQKKFYRQRAHANPFSDHQLA